MSVQNNASDSALVSNHQRGSPSMNTHDDDLRVRLGRIRSRGSHYKGFFVEVRSAAGNEGHRSRSQRVPRLSPSYFGRGRGAALRRRSGPGSNGRYTGGPCLVPDSSIRPDASSSMRASCIPAGRGHQASQRMFAISSAMVYPGPAKRRTCSPERPTSRTNGLRGADHAPRLEGGLSRLRLDRVDPVERQSW
jgi:hypothetical protein